MAINLTDKLYAATGSQVIADAIQVAGGYMAITKEQRANLTSAQKVVGTLVYETDTNKTYRYIETAPDTYEWIELVQKQGDWNQNDETAPDYIKNRTHYEIDAEEIITLNVAMSSDTEGDGYPNSYYTGDFDTDLGADLDSLIGTEFTVTINGSTTYSAVLEYELYCESPIYCLGNWMSYLDGDIPTFGASLSEDGLAVCLKDFFDNNITDINVSLSYSQSRKELKQLDDKFIPDTIARNTEVERLVNSLGNLAHDDRYEGEGEDSFKSNNTTQSISKNSFSSGYATIAGAHCFKFAEHEYVEKSTEPTIIENVEIDETCKKYLNGTVLSTVFPDELERIVTVTCPDCGRTYQVQFFAYGETTADNGLGGMVEIEECTYYLQFAGDIPYVFYIGNASTGGTQTDIDCSINEVVTIPVDYDTSTKTGWYYLTSVEGITVDMKYTIVLDNNYDLRGVVLAVDPENNRIQASNYIIPNSSTATTIDEDSYILFPYYPEIGTDTIGTGALAEGFETKALAIASHTEGYATIAAGKYSHAEGRRTIATYSSHAEGWLTEAIGQGSHAEGYKAVSLGDGSHAEGYRTIASGARSHSEGYDTVSSGADSHAEGYLTTSAGDKSHAEGQSTTAEGVYSHSEGRETKALGESSHAEGTKTTASGSNTHAEGYQTNATGDRSHSEGRASTASGSNSHAEGYQTTASGSNSHAEGTTTTASANGSHAEGFTTVASKDYSHAEGYFTTSSGQASHAEGRYTAATSSGAHAEGYQTTASRENSHAEGQSTTIIPAEILGKGNDYILNYWKTNKTLIARGVASHAEGIDTAALGDGSHSEGKETLSRYIGAHSEGISTRAVANAAHSEGTDTRASSANQHAQGRYNIEDTSGKYAHILGNGTSDKRSNAHTIDWDGNAWFAGAVSASSIKIGEVEFTADQLTTLETKISNIESKIQWQTF